MWRIANVNQGSTKSLVVYLWGCHFTSQLSLFWGEPPILVPSHHTAWSIDTPLLFNVNARCWGEKNYYMKHNQSTGLFWTANINSKRINEIPSGDLAFLWKVTISESNSSRNILELAISNREFLYKQAISYSKLLGFQRPHSPAIAPLSWLRTRQNSAAQKVLVAWKRQFKPWKIGSSSTKW